MPKILIADDEPQVREMLEQTLEELEDEGVELITAGNGMEALEALRQHRPELVFMDVLMPKMNGLEVCKAARSQLGLRDTHIVLLTSQGQDYEAGQAEDAGVNQQLQKPLDPDAIYDMAMDILKR
ncbi:MAG: response regulator [Syntrophobacteraceae bacterium]